MSVKRGLTGMLLVMVLLMVAAGCAAAASPVTVEKLLENPQKYADRVVTVVDATVGKVPERGTDGKWVYPLVGEGNGSVLVRSSRLPEYGQSRTVTGTFYTPPPGDPASYYIAERVFPIWAYAALIAVLVLLAGVLIWQLMPGRGPTDGPPPPPPEPPVREATAVRCPSCDELNTEPGPFCTHCGASLGTQPPPPPREDPGVTGVYLGVGRLELETATGPQPLPLISKKKGAPVTIGRDPKNDIVLAHDAISGHHAHIRYDQDKDEFTIADLDSTNGTFVNGNRITKQVLQDNDVIQFGPYQKAKFRRI